ncbi:MAG: cytochrome c3 family protein [Planctomycetota bacterium]|jgi:cytochrome b subunit of formate dehydrogenase
MLLARSRQGAIAVAATLLLLFAFGPCSSAFAEEGNACLECHGDPGQAEGRLVDGDRFARSVHSDMDCTDCHDGFDEYPHAAEEVETAHCAGCHDAAAEAIAGSVHQSLLTEELEDAQTSRACASCHGLHDVFPSDDPDSRLWPLTVPRTCGNCHFDHEGVREESLERLLQEPYMDDTHGHGLLRAGLITAPNCVTCHGDHDILHSSDPEARVHPNNVSEACGACHGGILQQYRKSIHGMTPRGNPEENGNHREPATCSDCHEPHGIQAPNEDFKLQVIKTCTQCHAERGNTYRGTYHGRITTMGFADVATCDACHTPHQILPASDPNSAMHPDNRAESCAKCHEGATDEFAAYAVHADAEDKEGWPVLYWARFIMRSIILVTWVLAGAHLLLWLQRALRQRKEIREELKPVSGRWYRRFPATYRVIHFMVVFSFLLLALTGLPLRYSDRDWSKVIFDILGGPESVRFLHRVGGAMTFTYFGVYIVHIMRRLFRGERGLFRGPNSMVPRWKDVQDIKGNFRWFFKGGKQPKFDRWTYWEKFDFWAEVWGVGFIGITGLIMWFPVAFTKILPGWAINLAHVLHSYEALLATSFIFTMHFFHANLRPGKFPLDPLFLTGRISEEELKAERPLEYERMRREGRLESEVFPPPEPRIVRRAYVLGGFLLSLGILLLVLMFTSIF